MKTYEKEIQKAQRILDETLNLLKENIECEVLAYHKGRYKSRFFTKGRKQGKGVRVKIPEEWIEDTSAIDHNIREELKTFLTTLEGKPKSSRYSSD